MIELNKWVYVGGFLIAFVGTFLRGFQHKNVIGNHYRAAFFTSYLMAAFDVLSVTLTVYGGLWMIPFVGTGAAVGIVLAMHLHSRLFK